MPLISQGRKKVRWRSIDFRRFLSQVLPVIHHTRRDNYEHVNTKEKKVMQRARSESFPLHIAVADFIATKITSPNDLSPRALHIHY